MTKPHIESFNSVTAISQHIRVLSSNSDAYYLGRNGIGHLKALDVFVDYSGVSLEAINSTGKTASVGFEMIAHEDMDELCTIYLRNRGYSVEKLEEE